MSEKKKSITFDSTADKESELRKQSHGQVSKKALKEVTEKARMEVKSRYALGALQAVDVLIVANTSGCVTQNVLTPLYLFVNGELKAFDEVQYWKSSNYGSKLLFRALALSCEAKWDSALLSAGAGVYDDTDCENWPIKGKGWDACSLKFVETFGPWRDVSGHEPNKFQTVVSLKKKYVKAAQLNRSFFRKKEDGDPRRIYLYRSSGVVEEEPAKSSKSSKKKGKKEKKSRKKSPAKDEPYEVFLLENSKDPIKMLERCSDIMTEDGPEPLTDEWRDKIQTAVNRIEAREGMVIGLSFKSLDPEKYHKKYKFETSPPNFPIRDGYTFLGMLGARDLPRGEMPHCFRVCRNMRVKVIVASAYLGPIAMKKQCERIGYLKERDHTLEDLAELSSEDSDIEIASDKVKVAQIDGYTIDEMDEDELDMLLAKRRVIIHRSRRVDVIVDALHKHDKVVAVVGGSFDTSALTKADVGISGGVYSAKRSKKAADITLKDGSFKSVVQALSVVRPYEQKKGVMGKFFGKKKKKSAKPDESKHYQEESEESEDKEASKQDSSSAEQGKSESASTSSIPEPETSEESPEDDEDGGSSAESSSEAPVSSDEPPSSESESSEEVVVAKKSRKKKSKKH